MTQTNTQEYNRIVIKAGTGVVTDHGKTLDLSTLKDLVSQISKLKLLQANQFYKKMTIIISLLNKF